MTYHYNKLSFDLQEIINKKIRQNNKIYFKKNIIDELVYKGKCKHIIRYIIDYYIGPFKMYNKYAILIIDLIGFLESYFENGDYKLFLLKIFNTCEFNEINIKYNYRDIVYKIFNNLCYKKLCYYKEQYCTYYIHHGCLF